MINALRNFIQQQSEADRFSGAVLVAKDNKIILEYACGYANKEKEILNSIDTKFNLGSLNKMFTGVAIAQLVQRGKLSFADTVGTYLHKYPNDEVKEKVTIHHLLTHTSGMGHYLNEKYMLSRTKLKTIDDFVSLFADDPLLFEPGTKCQYSANGFTLLGKIIEVITGETYYEYIRNNIFTAAKMHDTDSYEIITNDLDPDIAVGYTNRTDIQGNVRTDGIRVDNLWINLIKGDSGGSGYSTCHDLLNFAIALINNKLLSPEMTKLVLTPHVYEGSKDGQSKNEGYGFQVWDINGYKRIGHPGRFAGVNARFDVYPDLGYTVIVLANFDPPSAFDIAEKAMELIIPKSLK
jgi:CubicO group peptidase (beta-lactamase class C family)